MKKNIFPIGALCAALLGIIALIMPAATFISVSYGGQVESRSGFFFIFGADSNGASATAWSLVLIGVLFAIVALVLAFMLKKDKFAALALVGSGLLLIVGAILYFFFIRFAPGNEQSQFSILIQIAQATESLNVSLGVGAWLGGIAGILGGVAGIGAGAYKLLKK